VLKGEGDMTGRDLSLLEKGNLNNHSLALLLKIINFACQDYNQIIRDLCVDEDFNL
jgi:hypothetical protein